MCRPAFHPTAHLITTVAGPFVTFVLWLGLGFASVTVKHLLPSLIVTREMMMLFSSYNLLLLIFNLVPAFPMDGGRILRDVLWHWMHIERATDIAVFVSRLLAVLIVFLVVVPANAWLEPALRLGLPAALVFFAADLSGDYWMILMAAFIFLQGIRERQYLAYEAGGVYGFSIRDRLRRGRRQRAFKAAVAESGQTSTTTAFHRCAACGRTEHDAPALEFRVCPDCQGGEEYCTEHLEAHQHV
jgi:hypothetical protein